MLFEQNAGSFNGRLEHVRILGTYDANTQAYYVEYCQRAITVLQAFLNFLSEESSLEISTNMSERYMLIEPVVQAEIRFLQSSVKTLTSGKYKYWHVQTIQQSLINLNKCLADEFESASHWYYSKSDSEHDLTGIQE